MRIVLSVRKGTLVQKFAFIGDKLVLGRHGDLPLNDDACSRQHAEIYLSEEGNLHIRDLESTNGTLVGGRRIEDTRIVPGSMIQIGGLHVQVMSFSGGEIVQASWPGLYRCLPREAQARFETCIAEESA